MEKTEEKKDEWVWHPEQEKLVGEMISESESIGYTQGHDDAIKEISSDLETKLRHLIFVLEQTILELKSKIYRKDEK